VYLDLYEMHGEPRMKQDVQTVFDWVLDNQLDTSLEFIETDRIVEHWGGRRFDDVRCKWRWCWADAVFMAPPVWLHLSQITGDPRYLEFADREFWEMTEYLYDTEEHLYLRDSRYFDVYASNGKGIFWGRGNGWVYAGLARMLEHLPEDHANRARYEQLFREMGEKLIAIQSPDGSWRTSLLDPESIDIPESSGTGLLVFGLAWGVNNGLLDRATFEPAIRKGWESLVNAVQPDGMLGWVQPVGYEPGSATANDSHLYGVGAFLLSAAEITRMLEQ
jgi:rhamnogalacturonyl hydrolase YesR